jgi:folate-dependent phosphoribosylglycinamide formyltransferase PurN
MPDAAMLSLHTLSIGLFRQARDAGVWRPSHVRLLIDQVAGRARNEHAGYSDGDHLEAAVEWLGRAQDATGNGGIAGRYRLKSGWTSAYPETTGYIIPTFLALAESPGCERFRDRASRCVEFLLPLQLPNGAFPSGEIREGAAAPSFFNTAQILGGLTAWHRATGDERSLNAARKAADWLLTLQDADGAFRRHLYHDIVTTYSAHASCWIAELGQHTGNTRYLNATRRHVDWVLSHQDAETGWIDLCGFSEEHHRARHSVTHTIAYTLGGILASAQILGHARAAVGVTQAALGIARRLELSGWLPGVLDHRWRPAAAFSCLTGNVQLALVWFALFERSGDSRFLNAALKAIDLVKRAQPMTSRHPGIQGGIPGSDPVWGDYIRLAVPNWSAKFFIDALLKKRTVLSALPSRARGLAPLPADVRRTLPDIPPPVPTRQVRAVVLATPASRKVVQMVHAWDWGFRPAAVVLLSRPARSRWARLWQRVAEEGVTFGRRRHPRRRAAETAPGAAGRANVRACCREAGIPTVDVDSFESPKALEAIRKTEPDLFVFAGGAILRAPLLAIPRLGTLNAHMGLLPFYRGMNVAEWACFHGDQQGCSVHLIDPGIDTGDILVARPIGIDGIRSISALRAKIDEAQMALLGDVVQYVTRVGSLPPRRSQAADEGRQFFRMHGELLELLERDLASGDAEAGRLEESEPVVSLSR